MARPKKPATESVGNGTTAMALTTTMTRTEAFARARELAVAEYQAKRSEQQREQQHFIEQYGRIDKIDRAYADDIRRLLVRTLAIAKSKGNGSGADPKITKLATMLSEMLASIELNLAQDNVQDLFGRVDEREFLQQGYTRATVDAEPEQWIGERATAAKAFLDGVTIVDPPKTLTKRDVAKRDLEMEKKARAADEQHQRDRENHAAIRRTAQAGCEHGTRTELAEEDRFETFGDVMFTHTCALCNADVANYDGKWYTEIALEERLVAEEEGPEK